MIFLWNQHFDRKITILSIPMIFPVAHWIPILTRPQAKSQPSQPSQPSRPSQLEATRPMMRLVAELVASTTGYMANHGEIWVCWDGFLLSTSPCKFWGWKLKGKPLMNPWWRTSFSPMRSRIFGIHLIFSTQIHGESWFETGVTFTSSFSQEATWSSRGYKHSLELVEKGCRIKGVLRYSHFKCRNFSVLLVTMVTWWL